MPDASSGSVTFLFPHKKVTKESGIGEALCAELPLVKSALSYGPLPAALGSALEHLNFDPVPRKNVPIFPWQYTSVENRDEPLQYRKCAPGDSQGVALARGSATFNSPLSRLLWDTFLAETRKVCHKMQIKSSGLANQTGASGFSVIINYL